MIKIYIRFPLTDITSKYEQKKAKQIHSISVQYPFLFFLLLLLAKKNSIQQFDCNRIIDLQEKKKVIDTSMKVSWRQSIFTFPVL